MEVHPTQIDMTIPDDIFASLSTMVTQRFGIQLPPVKKTMVASRFYPIVRRSGCASFREYYQRYLKAPTAATLSGLVDALSTNHTYFYREANHYDALLRVCLPEISQRLSARGERDLRVWCAAASTGEEPYTLAILQREFFGGEFNRWQAGLLATDISERALQIAIQGVYEEESVRKLPQAWQRYFRSCGGGKAASMEVLEEVKADVTFRRFNLMNTILPFKRSFHIVFIRNVMIYFDDPTKTALIQRIYNKMEPGGYLFIGHSETLDREACPLQLVAPGMYKKG